MKILVSAMIFIFFVSLCSTVSTVRAQESSDSPNNGQNYQYRYARFSPSLAVIIVVLIAALFFVGFFAIYIRHCSSDSSAASGGIRGATSTRARMAAAARGLDASVIEGFPTFSYAEVKDHKIGKGVLECAVCLSEFQDEDTLRLLPKCDHVFHPQCIDAWLESHVTCPVCRANLVPQDGEGAVRQVPESTPEAAVEGGPRSEQDDVVILITDEDSNNQTQSQGNEDASNRDYKSRSVKRPKRMFSFSKFRSNSTGHDSLVPPAGNLDRFTLRLPAGVRKEVMDRASLNRTKSFAANSGLPRMGSSRSGYRVGAGEGSSRAGRFSRRSDGAAKSDRWVFFTRAFSMRSPRVVAETGEGSNVNGSVGRTLVNMRSFNCLESRVNDGDEEGLFSDKPERSGPV